MTQAPLVVQEVPGVPKHGSGIGQSGASVDAEMNQEVSSRVTTHARVSGHAAPCSCQMEGGATGDVMCDELR